MFEQRGLRPLMPEYCNNRVFLLFLLFLLYLCETYLTRALARRPAALTDAFVIVIIRMISMLYIYMTYISNLYYSINNYIV